MNKKYKSLYTAPTVRIADTKLDMHFLASAKFEGGSIDDATEEEWTY